MDISGVEVVFGTGGLLAFACGIALLVKAAGDLRDLDLDGRNGLLHIAARSSYRRELGRVIRQLLLLAVTAISMTQPDPSGAYADSAARRAIVLLLLVFQWGLVIEGLHDLWARRRMIRYDARRDRRATDRPPR